MAAPHKYFIHSSQVKNTAVACPSMQAFRFACCINIGVVTVDLIWIFLDIYFCRSFEKWCLSFFLIPYHGFLLGKDFFLCMCMTALFGNSENASACKKVLVRKDTFYSPKGTIYILWLFFSHQIVTTWFSVLSQKCF